MKKRNIQLDIAKGIGIILVVLGHTAFPYTHFIYLFHLAIFFIMSGYFFKEDYVKDFNSFKFFIINKIKRLYLPFVIGNSICILLNNFFININLYSNLTHNYFTIKDMFINIFKILLFKGTSEMLGATWFLQILFLIMIFYAIIEYFIKKVKNSNVIQLLVSITMLFIGYILAIKNINIKIIPIQVFTCYILFDFGRKFKNIRPRTEFKFRPIILIILFFALIIFNKIGTIEISLNQYTNPLYFISVSIIGWLFVYEVSYYLAKTKFVSEFIQYIGKNTMIILILHFAVFKFVNFLGIIILNKDITLVGTFPVLFKDNCWWIIYTILGIGIPLFINILIKLVIDKIKMKRSKYNEIRCSNSNL